MWLFLSMRGKSWLDWIFQKAKLFYRVCFKKTCIGFIHSVDLVFILRIKKKKTYINASKCARKEGMLFFEDC